jgi:short-subunit dehydrogenase
MAKRTLTDHRALVTGASSGIGRALALELAPRGCDLVLIARREDRLAAVAREVNNKFGRRAEIVVGDITDPAARQQALDVAQQKLGGLDILVNNAGASAHGRFADADPARLRPIMETNFFAPVELIRAALPLLRNGRHPIIVNIGSILGERACPHKSEYSASKFALHGFSEALRAELTGDGIDVLVVAAGPTDTEFFDHLIENRGQMPWKQSAGAPPEQVARAIVHGIERGRHEVVIDWQSWFWLLLNRVAPRLIDRIMAGYGMAGLAESERQRGD